MGIRSFIPNRISNRFVVRFLDSLRRTGRRFHISWSVADRHAQDNKTMVRKMFPEDEYGVRDGSDPRYLENQRLYSGIRFGKTDMAYAGCEIIAAYNAMHAFGRLPDLGELIRVFEKYGMIFSGRFGTSPLALVDYFTGKGFEVEYTFHREDFDELAKRADVLIYTFYNDSRSIFRQIHTICVTKEDGGYRGHNIYGDGSSSHVFAGINDMTASIGEGYAKGIILIGIKTP